MPSSADPVAFGERLLSLLEQGRFTATYKFAVLLGLIDVCLESTDGSGSGPSKVPTTALSEKVADLYWRQTVPFAPVTGVGEAQVLKQNITGQAEMVSLVSRFRDRASSPVSGQLSAARARQPDAYAKLLRDLEWKLAQMPLPRLQLVGKTRSEFLYKINWDESISRTRFFASGFDRSLEMIPGASDQLIRLSGLLRPLIQREWASWIARHAGNQPLIKEAYLDEFLFGASRTSLARVAPGLREIQAGQCFYCGKSAKKGEVDHFIPWSRSGDDGIQNLVLACSSCNNSKRNHLAAGRHVERWAGRFSRDHEPGRELHRLAESLSWESDPHRTASIARALYVSLPDDILLWDTRDSALPFGPDESLIQAALDVSKSPRPT